MNESVLTSKIMDTFRSILAGQMPSIKTSITVKDKIHCSFLLSYSNFNVIGQQAISQEEFEGFTKAYLLYANKGNGFLGSVELESVEGSANQFQCKTTIPGMQKYTKFSVRTSWPMYIVFEQGDGYFMARLKELGPDVSPKKKGELFYDRSNQHDPEYETFLLGEKTIVSMLARSKNGLFTVITVEKKRQYLSQFVIKCEAMKLSNHQIHLCAKTEKMEYNWNGFVLHFRSQKDEDAVEYVIPATFEKNGKEGILKGEYDISTLLFKPTIWDVYAQFEKDGTTYQVLVRIGEKSFYNAYCKLTDSNIIAMRNGFILYPYRSKGGTLGLNYKKKTAQDSYWVRFKERLALRYYEKKKAQLGKRQIYLVYEKYSAMAQDNGYYFFKYCMEHNMAEKMNREIYYVIDKHSSDYEKLKPYRKNVISFLSFKYFVYMQAAKLLISSDNRLHAFIWHPLPSYMPDIIAQKKHVFLQHGVTALKRVRNVFDKEGQFATNLFIVTSELEKRIVSKFYRYEEEELAVTGFSRWDVLEDKSGDQKEILVMPTWRIWLDSMTDEQFQQSEYYKRYTALLNSPRLKKLLEQHDIIMNFYIHPKFRDYISNFASNLPNVKLIAFDDMPLNELLMRCKLLITDYSSVSWDVFYQKKPVLFYQFDLVQYNEANGSFIDMEKDLFGDRTEDETVLLDLIEENMKDNFKIKEKYLAKFDDSFAYVDHDNSKRICEAIMQKGW